MNRFAFLFIFLLACSQAPVACTEEAKLCPDGSAVGRTGPNCEFAPCPVVECSSDSDCVKDSCCHADGCVSKVNAPDCDGMFCTQECKPGSLDCGGSCGCVAGKCVGQNYFV